MHQAGRSSISYCLKNKFSKKHHTAGRDAMLKYCAQIILQWYFELRKKESHHYPILLKNTFAQILQQLSKIYYWCIRIDSCINVALKSLHNTFNLKLNWLPYMYFQVHAIISTQVFLHFIKAQTFEVNSCTNTPE